MKPSYFQPILIHNPSAEPQPLEDYIESLLDGFSTQPIQHINNQEPLKIQQVRALQQGFAIGPPSAATLYLISQCDTASLPAMHALLKILEEPPMHVLLVLTTTNLQQIIPTIQSRCRIHTIYHQVKTEQSVLTDYSYQNIIAYANKHKNVDQAQKILNQELIHRHQLLHTHPTQSYLLKQERILLQALRDLQTATSPQLVLEHCFFSIKKLEQVS